MNTEFRIPPPQLTYARKESLKREPDTPWLRMAAVAASISLLLGLYMLLEPKMVTMPKFQLAEIRIEVKIDTVIAPILTTKPTTITTTKPTKIEQIQPTNIQTHISNTNILTYNEENITLVHHSFAPIIPNFEVSLQPLSIPIPFTPTQTYKEKTKLHGALRGVIQKVPVMIADLGESITIPFKNINSKNIEY